MDTMPMRPEQKNAHYQNYWFFIGLVLIANGAELILIPSFSRRTFGVCHFAFTISIPILVQYGAQLDENRETRIKKS